MRRGVQMTQYEAAHRKRTRVAALLIFVFIPVTVAFLTFVLNLRNYMVLSLIILVYTMIPFFMIFERRRPRAREVVLVAMMSALTVVISLLFHVALPVLMGGTAMVIISGVAMGPEAGFLVGALSRFVLNFFEGQGSWTPWQMFCWGLLAFLAGMCFSKVDAKKPEKRSVKAILIPVMCVAAGIVTAYVSYILIPTDDGTFFGWRLYVFGAAGLAAGVLLQRKRMQPNFITLSVFTFFTIFIIYGGIMNVCAMVTSAGIDPTAPISWTTLRALYISGVPYDLIHAGTAAAFIFLFGESIIRKVERVKVKYGIYR